jgi:hypothetical protein
VIPSLRLTCYGPSGTGKSHFLSTVVRRAPRVVTLDMTGEGRTTYPDAIGPFFGLRDVCRAVQTAANLSDAWHIIAAMDEREIPQFFRMLVPRFDGRSVSLAEALGGVAVESGEVDMIAPNAGSDPDVLGAWQRGRHFGLSLLTAVQRPASAARIVSAQAQWLAAFVMTEPRDTAFLGAYMGDVAAGIVEELPRYHCALYERDAARVFVLDQNRRAYACYDRRGDALPLTQPALLCGKLAL